MKNGDKGYKRGNRLFVSNGMSEVANRENMHEVTAREDSQVEEEEEVEAERVEEETPEIDVPLLNGVPSYSDQHTVNGCKVYERIGWDDKVGASYLVFAGEKELVMRVDSPSKVVSAEIVFLNKVEKKQLWRHFSQVHSSWTMNDRAYLTVYFRPGPTLRQCVDYCKGKFSAGTISRLGKDILQIVQSVHSLDYVIRCLNVDLFHLDAASRHLFMADISSLRVDPAIHGLDSAWVGGPLYAPVNFDKHRRYTRGDELEAVFYMIAHLANGGLPWDSVQFDEVTDTKENTKWDAILPPRLAALFPIVATVRGHVSVPQSIYEKMAHELDEMAKEANVKDEEDNYDFEREPLESELPKFELVRDDE